MVVVGEGVVGVTQKTQVGARKLAKVWPRDKLLCVCRR